MVLFRSSSIGLFCTHGSGRLFLTFPGGTMGKKLYIGNLPYSVDDSVLQEEFQNLAL
jgi:hypothetical protein